MLSIFSPSLAVMLLIPSVMALMLIMALRWLGSVKLEDQLKQKKDDLLVKSAELNERFAYKIQQAEISLQTFAQSSTFRTFELAFCQERVEQLF